jgi:hypothetical protein
LVCLHLLLHLQHCLSSSLHQCLFLALNLLIFSSVMLISSLVVQCQWLVDKTLSILSQFSFSHSN